MRRILVAQKASPCTYRYSRFYAAINSTNNCMTVLVFLFVCFLDFCNKDFQHAKILQIYFTPFLSFLSHSLFRLSLPLTSLSLSLSHFTPLTLFLFLSPINNVASGGAAPVVHLRFCFYFFTSFSSIFLFLLKIPFPPRRWRSGFERSLRKRKVGSSNPSRDRPK